MQSDINAGNYGLQKGVAVVITKLPTTTPIVRQRSAPVTLPSFVKLARTSRPVDQCGGPRMLCRRSWVYMFTWLYRSFEVNRKGLVLPRRIECHRKNHGGGWITSESVQVSLARLPMFLWKFEVHNGKVTEASCAS